MKIGGTTSPLSKGVDIGEGLSVVCSPTLSRCQRLPIAEAESRKDELESTCLGRLNTSKDSFITWIAIQGRLKTNDRLVRMGITGDTQCVLYCQTEETSSHLMLENSERVAAMACFCYCSA
ncbi:hypothetical protein F8388_017959 [Cannabis sativa]|uniref:Reverse transcriptase zinc-binding domain-containing protein n=1 Tax=Cannabis sativa TaxID=3483 RepID=A0A7J6E5L9_CANSA|nr:hypothetical protein F8388_017959 [Cannabis sativa]